jgi:hypothetical protein
MRRLARLVGRWVELRSSPQSPATGPVTCPTAIDACRCYRATSLNLPSIWFLFMDLSASELRRPTSRPTEGWTGSTASSARQRTPGIDRRPVALCGDEQTTTLTRNIVHQARRHGAGVPDTTCCGRATPRRDWRSRRARGRDCRRRSRRLDGLAGRRDGGWTDFDPVAAPHLVALETGSTTPVTPR